MRLRAVLLLLPSVVWAINYRCQNDQVLVVQSFGNDTIRMHCQKLDLCGYQKLRCDYDEHQPQCGGMMNFVAHVHQSSATSPVEHTCCQLFNPRPPHMVTTHAGNDCFIYELPDGSSVAKPKEDSPSSDTPLTVLKSVNDIPEHIDNVSGYRLRLFHLKNKSPPTLLVKGIERRLDGYRVTICRPRCTSIASAGQERAAASSFGTGDDGAEWKVISWSQWTSSSWSTWANSVGAEGERTRTRTAETGNSPTSNRDIGGQTPANINVDVDANGNNNNHFGGGAGGFDRPTVNGEQPGHINITIHTQGEGKGAAAEKDGANGSNGAAPNINVSANAQNHVHIDGAGKQKPGSGEDETNRGKGRKNGDGNSADNDAGQGEKRPSGGQSKGPHTAIDGEDNAEAENKNERLGKRPNGNGLGDGDGEGDGKDKGIASLKGANENRGSGDADGSKNSPVESNLIGTDGRDIKDGSGRGKGGSGSSGTGGDGGSDDGKKGGDGDDGQEGKDGSGDGKTKKGGATGTGDNAKGGKGGAVGDGGDGDDGQGDKDNANNGKTKKGGAAGTADGTKGGKGGAGGDSNGGGKEGGGKGGDGSGETDKDLLNGKGAENGAGDGGNGANGRNGLKDGRDGADGSKGATKTKGKDGKDGGDGIDLHAGKGPDGIDAGNGSDNGGPAKSGKNGKEGLTEGEGENGQDGKDGKAGGGGAIRAGKSGEDGIDAGSGDKKEPSPIDKVEATWTEGGPDAEAEFVTPPVEQKRQPNVDKNEIGKASISQLRAGAGPDGVDAGEKKGPSGKSEEEAAAERKEHGEGDDKELEGPGAGAAGVGGGKAAGNGAGAGTGGLGGTTAGSGKETATGSGAAGAGGASASGGAAAGKHEKPSQPATKTRGQRIQQTEQHAQMPTKEQPDGVKVPEGVASDAQPAPAQPNQPEQDKGSGENTSNEQSPQQSAPTVSSGAADSSGGAAATAPQSDTPSANSMIAAMNKMNCFPADSLVTTVLGPKRMDQLQVGDFVLVPSSENVLKYERVEMFYHREETTRAQFVVIMTKMGKRMALTPLHLLPFGKCDEVMRAVNSSEGVSELLGASRFAQHARVGDCVLSLNEEGDLVADKISKIGRQYSEGIYSPMTVEGSLVVDGVLASCFAQLESHSVHKTVFDFLMYFRNIFGYGNHVHHDVQGIPSFISYVHDLSHYVLPFAKY